MKTIIISSDHNGVEDKQQLKTYLKGEGYRVIDIGPYTPEVSVDYVDYAAQLSTIVGNKEADRGILICGTGVGMSIVANRMPGEITKDKIRILKIAEDIFINSLKNFKLYDKIWQAYAALLPVKTVGVMGDNRTYEYMCLLRAITSEDGMTADTFDFNKEFMQIVSNKIINDIKGINRVVYDITSKPPSTIELE